MSTTLKGYVLVASLLCVAVSGRMLVSALRDRDGVGAGLGVAAFGVWLALSAYFVWGLV